MKKILLCLLIIVCFIPFQTVSANMAEGYIYSTDILAFVNGKPIEGYNIGGKTVIIAEDLTGYGFGIEYNDETRTLKIESYFHSGFGEFAQIPRGEVGRITGKIYKTDIKVYYNGIPISGYNIGGRTAICIEELGDITQSPNGEYGYSQYLGKSIWNPDERTISFESYLRNENEILGISRVYHRFKDNVIYTYSDDYYKKSGFSAEESDGFTGMYSYSAGTGASKYLIKPLYFDNHGELVHIGTTVVNPNNVPYEAVMYIENPEMVKDMIKTFKTPQMNHDDALKYFTEVCINVEKIENDCYTVLKAEHEAEGLIFVYINKKGGFVTENFLNAYGMNSYKNTEIKMWFDETKKNTVVFSVYPYGGPHGPVTAQFESNLDELDYE